MERLTEADSRILALERGNIRGHTMKLVMAGGAVSADSLRDQVDARLDLMPRLRMRLAEGSEPALVEDTEFSVTNHVRVGASDPLDERGLLDAVARLMETRLDRARPLWAVDVLPLMTDGSSAVALRMHHAVADGTVMLHAVRSLLLDGDDKPAPPAARPPTAGVLPCRPCSGASLRRRFRARLSTARRATGGRCRSWRPSSIEWWPSGMARPCARP